MKYIKKFEDTNDSLFKSKDEWKVGDIIVATKNMYDRSTRWIIKDHKYKITEIEKNDPPLKDRMLLTDMNGDDYDYHYHYFKDDFIDLEQWEILNNIDKYNL